MVNINKKNNHLIDFSIMPTLKCNLSCSFCQYNCGPNQSKALNLWKTINFVRTINFNKINSIGFYGGEISIEKILYSYFIGLIPSGIEKFCITNGTWSDNYIKAATFVRFVKQYNLKTFISSTPEHKKFQNKDIIDRLVKRNDLFSIKDDDTKDRMLPMGRNFKEDWTCTKKCMNWNKPHRYALMPDGNIIFQSCDGIYPYVGTYEEKFKEVVSDVRKYDVPCT